MLTKADLVTPELLSACVGLLRHDLSELLGTEASTGVEFSAVCGISGAGVNALWKELQTMCVAACYSGGFSSLEAFWRVDEGLRFYPAFGTQLGESTTV